MHKLVQAKQGADLHTAIFNQMLVYETARGGFLDRHVRWLSALCRERRDVMLTAMDEYFPARVRWSRPKEGLFVWVTLPERIDATAVLKIALEQQVAFIPGAPFHLLGGGANTLRLNFTNATPDQIRLGIMRLGRVLHQVLGPSPVQVALAA